MTTGRVTLKEATRQLANYKAILDAMEFEFLDEIGSQSIEQCTHVGKEACRLMKLHKNESDLFRIKAVQGKIL